MHVLLDENLPLRLHDRLRSAGYEADHIVPLGQRGLPDRAIRHRIATEPVVFVTHDTEFEDVPTGAEGKVIISRIPQAWPIEERVRLWFAAITRFLADPPPGHLFDLLPSGEIVPVAVFVAGQRSQGPLDDGD